MSEEKFILSMTEKILFEAAKEEFCAEINSAFNNLAKSIPLLYQYLSFNDDELQDIAKWFDEIVRFRFTNNGFAFDRISKELLPECINKALLTKAVEQFMSDVTKFKRYAENAKYKSLDERTHG